MLHFTSIKSVFVTIFFNKWVRGPSRLASKKELYHLSSTKILEPSHSQSTVHPTIQLNL